MMPTSSRYLDWFFLPFTGERLNRSQELGVCCVSAMRMVMAQRSKHTVGTGLLEDIGLEIRFFTASRSWCDLQQLHKNVTQLGLQPHRCFYYFFKRQVLHTKIVSLTDRN